MPMKTLFTQTILLLCSSILLAQEPILNTWQYNTTNKKASYYETSGNMEGITFTFVNSDTDADILEVVYDDDYVYVRSEGMTDNMGQFQNPGAPSAQGYVWKFHRTPTEATSHEEVEIVNSIGVLTNGIPIFGTGDSRAWDPKNQENTTSPQGGYWNGNAYYSEGETLDTAFAAHPQQQGAYHTHATPFRLYDEESSAGHSPIVGFANDGFPIYGPFGYSDAENSSSSIKRMESSYELRTISTRTTFAGSSQNLKPEERGPEVSDEHPLGEYNEDYEYTEGLGDLDEHNGRYCTTPEYPNGTYAYFVTTDINGGPTYPYYIGTTYYGEVIAENNSTSTQVDFPTSGVETVDPENLPTSLNSVKSNLNISFFPNPANDQVNIIINDAINIQMVSIVNQEGRIISNTYGNGENELTIDVSKLSAGTYFITVQSPKGMQTQKLVVGAK